MALYKTNINLETFYSFIPFVELLVLSPSQIEIDEEQFTLTK